MIDSRKKLKLIYFSQLQKYSYVRMGDRNSETKEISTWNIEGVICVLLTAYSKVRKKSHELKKE